jgi:hypothetical protein
MHARMHAHAWCEPCVPLRPTRSRHLERVSPACARARVHASLAARSLISRWRRGAWQRVTASGTPAAAAAAAAAVAAATPDLCVLLRQATVGKVDGQIRGSSGEHVDVAPVGVGQPPCAYLCQQSHHRGPPSTATNPEPRHPRAPERAWSWLTPLTSGLSFSS